MCGIAALFRVSSMADAAIAARALEKMTRSVAHRGPDGEGIDLFPGPDGAFAFGLGHRRLSILDLSEAGRQPMRRGDVVVTYNGEIYNYVELRRELEREGHAFRTQSDTEVLLAAYEAWGEAAFARLRGMWAFVLVDLRRRVAFACRDRLGIKPLYFCAAGGFLSFVSEPKQLAHAPSVRLRASTGAVAAYLASGYEDSRVTMFEGVTPVGPGTYRVLELDSGRLGEEQRYWFPERIIATMSDRREAARAFAGTFRDSVNVHMRSDVPVGCALSGGLDSSAIFKLAAPLARGLMHTFSITFPGFAHDERRFVDAVLATQPAVAHFTTPSAEELAADLDRFVYMHDEPVGSISQYAAYAIARTTRAHGVPVTLNGQGGDEVLAGYWQTYAAHLLSLARAFSPRLLSELGGSLLPGGNDQLLRTLPSLAKRGLSRLMPSRELRVRGLPEASSTFARRMLELSEAERRIFEIRELTLPRLLKWDDRNFMAFGVEGRYPFLDHEVIETCLGMEREALVHAGWTKEPIRRGLESELPSRITRRKTKVGFETPQQAWLNGALAPSVRALATSDSPAFHWVEPSEVKRLARRITRAGARDEAQALFRVLNVDRWMRVMQLEAA